MYLLDANVFTTPANSYYSFDLAPSFWDWLEQPDVRTAAVSVAAVRDEVTRGAGDLVDWAKRQPAGFWVADSEPSLAVVGRVAAWASGLGQYRDSALSEFMDSADIRLIGLAAVRGDTVVTHETPAPDSVKKVKIPDACAALSVPCIGPFAAFRDLGLRL